MKKRTRTAGICSLLSLLFSTILASTIFCITAYAGSINGNEQSIVSVIHGQFEQDGVVYKVRQEYINSAVSYLQQDDVDLTAEQAQAVISEIYSNVQTGVESGYLEPIGQAVPEEKSILRRCLFLLRNRRVPCIILRNCKGKLLVFFRQGW